MLLTGRQIRMARAFLEWTAEDLAKATNLSADTIHSFEKNSSRARESTVNAFVAAFDKFGVEFLPDEGIRIRRNETRNFVGKDGYKQFLDHIYETVKDGGHIRQFNVGDDKTLPYADDYAAIHMERMKKIKNLDARVLTQEGDYNFPAEYCTYRWLGKDNKLLIHYYVYNDFVAQALRRSGHNIEVISINSKLLSEEYVEQFEVLWKTAIVPDKKAQK